MRTEPDLVQKVFNLYYTYTKYFLEFNEFIVNDNRVESVMLTIADGLTIVRKKWVTQFFVIYLIRIQLILLIFIFNYLIILILHVENAIAWKLHFYKVDYFNRSITK